MRTTLLLLLVASQVVADDYHRPDWNHWVDYDGDCTNLRHELLLQTSLIPVKWDDCRVHRGVWVGPYSGAVFTNSSRLDLDHVVPLKWAHEHGGAQWSEWVKELFANDLENLLLVSARENRRKGAKGPDRYLPAQGRCVYLRRWQRVVTRYRLTPNPEVTALLQQPCKETP